MSRTYKDKPFKLKFEPWNKDTVDIPCIIRWINFDNELVEYPSTYSLQAKTTKPKKRKHVNTESYWYKRTPSWWTHLFMLKPQRRKGRVWEHEVVKCNIDALEDSDAPGVSKKPHKYFW